METGTACPSSLRTDMWSLLKQVTGELVTCTPHCYVFSSSWKHQNCLVFFFPEWVSHVPTTDGRTKPDSAPIPVYGIFERSQGARSPAIPPDPLDNNDCIDLPTYVSLIAEQSKTDANAISTQTLIPTEDAAGPCLAEAVNIKESEGKENQVEEICNTGLRYITVKPCDVAPEQMVLPLSPSHNSLTDSNNSIDGSSAYHVRENNIQLCDATNESNAIGSEKNGEESDIAMPLNHCMDDENEDVPLISLPAAYVQPVMPPFFTDPRKEITHRGCLVSSKIMKRSSSVISDSGIESEPSSVAWPLDTALRSRPPLDFSSEREIPQQMVCGLQMESNGSLPSAGIQASLTSISSLPYEEDQQQRQLSKLTKSVSAPQISSPEDTEEEHLLLNQETNAKGSEQAESPPLDPKLTTTLGQSLNEFVNSEKSSPPQYLSETHTCTSVLSGVSEVSLLQESVKSAHVKESAVTSSQRENLSHQTHISEVSASVEDVHLVETEAVPCSCGSTPCAHKNAADHEKIHTADECRLFHQAELLNGQECLDPSQTPQVPSRLPHLDDLPDGTSNTQRPSDLAGLVVNDMTSSLNLSDIPASEKEDLACQTKSSKIPNSGLAFVNKKMVEVVNMSVSCAPTCLPFSSALRDSPSISGMSPRQATSPITHQPLGSFGIISSSSLNPLHMDDESNERMLKWVQVFNLGHNLLQMCFKNPVMICSIQVFTVNCGFCLRRH